MTDTTNTYTLFAGPVLASMAAGASIADSARSHEISPRTVYRWLARGRRDPTSAYGPFADQVDRLRDLRRLPTAGHLMAEDEFRECVWRAARAGSVPAMRLAWKILRADEEAAGAC